MLRTAYAEVPPRVEYELTALGRSLSGTVAHLVHWVRDHQAEIVRNRDASDQGDSAARPSPQPEPATSASPSGVRR